jgi:2-polyprenyl-6-methoxyphenol hydroxylase-like FAD-dependent oxidoreductase
MKGKMMSLDFDVVIVGYGPVGQYLALRLGRAGLKVAAVERYSSLYNQPRAVHFDHEIARSFQAAGIIDEVMAISESEPEGSVFRYTGCDGETIMIRTFGGMGQSGWPFTTGFPQQDLEQIMDNAARALPNVQVMQGWECIALSQSTDQAEISVRRRDDQTVAPVTLTGKYIIGADGANSFVRKSIGVTQTDLDHSFDWLVVNLIYRQVDVKKPGMVQTCDPARPTTVCPAGPGRQRFEFMLAPGETAAQMSTPEVTWALLEPWGLTPENVMLERHAVYTFNARWADTWRAGRVLLVGDAAHVMPPFMAQGLCSGLRDAAALAWRLQMVLAGDVPDTILDDYGTERVGHVSTVIRQAIEVGKVICITDPAAAAMRDAGMRAAMQAAIADPSIRPPPPPPWRLGKGMIATDNPQAGLLSFQGIVEYQGKTGLFDDVFGGGFTLIGTTFDPAEFLSPENRAFFDRIGGIVAHVTPDGPVRDVDGGYAAWFAENGIGASLARPDFYQVGATDDPSGVNALVDVLRIAMTVERVSETVI